jgi:hypothetical protein
MRHFAVDLFDKLISQPQGGARMQPTAQAVGVRSRNRQAPAGRQKLAPNVSLVVFHVIFLEKRQELLLK